MRAAIDLLRPPFRDSRWLKALEFSCVTSRDRVRVHFSVSFATNLGVAQSRVVVHDGNSASQVNLDFSDVQHQLPIGTSTLANAVLASGLSIRTIEPHGQFELEYTSVCGRVETRLAMSAAAPPVDDSFAIYSSGLADTEGYEADDPAVAGRIFQLLRVSGELRIDDTFHTIACTANIAHSWGSAPLVLLDPVGTDELHFGDRLSVVLHAVQGTPGWPTVRHGYLVRNGQLRRVVAATMSCDSSGEPGPTPLRYEITDDADETYRVTATPVASVGVDCGQNIYTDMRSLEAEWNDMPGYGQSSWSKDLRNLQREGRASRRARARTQDRSGS